ncbi:MAG: HD domain-containing protein [Candidatus Micrarchaeales archaeon]
MVGIVRQQFIDKEETSGGIGYRFFHSVRVYNGCKQFLKFRSIMKRDVDRDAVLVAALFHDAGRAKYYRRKPSDATMLGHENKSVMMIRALPSTLISKTIKDRAARIIESDGKDPRIAFEKEIVDEADTLDEAGVLAILRMFTYGVYKNETVEGRIKYWASKRRHMKRWLNRFKIPEIRKIAERRMRITDGIMAELEKEHEGKDLLTSYPKP